MATRHWSAYSLVGPAGIEPAPRDYESLPARVAGTALGHNACSGPPPPVTTVMPGQGGCAKGRDEGRDEVGSSAATIAWWKGLRRPYMLVIMSEHTTSSGGGLQNRAPAPWHDAEVVHHDDARGSDAAFTCRRGGHASGRDRRCDRAARRRHRPASGPCFFVSRRRGAPAAMPCRLPPSRERRPHDPAVEMPRA